MNTRRLRPKWTLGTMLIFVGWSAVMVSLNVRPRRVTKAYLWPGDILVYHVEHGFPWIWGGTETSDLWDFGSPDYFRYPALAANIAIGLLAVAVLTVASRALIRASISALRAFRSKPPPENLNGD